MQLSDKLNRLLAHAWELLDVPEEEIMEIALEQLIQNINASITPIEGGMDMKTILARAYERNQVSKGFTLDELMDDLYGDSPIFSPHKVKIQIGKLLLASGFQRKQVRRSKYDRPLWWFRVSSTDREE